MPPLSQLAPDALTALPTAEAIRAALSTKRAPIKAVLLDQAAVVAGVGNWVADEVLYVAKIHPAAPADSLDAAQRAALRDALRHVCETACAANADARRFPADWLFHHRWAKQTTGSISTPIGRVKFDTVGGRTTAFLPAVQRRGGVGAAAATPARKPAAGKKPAAPAGRKPAAAAAKRPSASKKSPKKRAASTDAGAAKSPAKSRRTSPRGRKASS